MYLQVKHDRERSFVRSELPTALLLNYFVEVHPAILWQKIILTDTVL